MKSLLQITLLAAACFTLAACGKRPQTITSEKDYAAFLKPQLVSAEKQEIESDIRFFNQRLEKDNGDIAAQIKMAGLLSRRFAYSGNMSDLHQSDSLYTRANIIQKHFGASVYRSLAANAITQHRFAQAAQYLDSAAALGDNRAQTLLQQFDAALELGRITAAKQYLHGYPAKKSFEYLVRLAKIKDHEGNLEAAVELMEQAEKNIISTGNTNLLCWVKANLGDYYGHSNQLKKAYRYYLETLRLNPQYYHAHKGIAWLAFSHDRNTAAARKILTYLTTVHPVPDYHLMLAEIAAYEKNEALAKQETDRFAARVRQPAYGNMYNKYLFEIYAGEPGLKEASQRIAITETAHRPAPAAYSWLAWAHYLNGDNNTALHLVQTQVEGRCFEPDALYYMAIIYKAAGQAQKAKTYLKELESAAFEMGPAFAQKVRQQMEQL